MNLASIATHVRRGNVHWALGRFKLVRTAYSTIRQYGNQSAQIYSAAPRDTLFRDINVDDAVREIATEAVCLGFQLPAEICASIEDFAKTQPLHAHNDPYGANFYYSDVHRGRTAAGREVPVGGVKNPMRCPAVRAVADDPKLRAIVREYLRFEPRKANVLLHWTFASDFSEDDCRRLNYGVIDYHYDVESFNFVYANFYIRDTDRDSGAHVMMKRSHNKKPLRLLLGSVKASEDEVRRVFGPENEIVIEGPAGTGFIQDTSCYHRATRAKSRDRLMLAIRFT